MKSKSEKPASQFDIFNAAMDTILHANPKAVKEAMEAEHKANAKSREEKGERKRGRRVKPTSAVHNKEG
jgi:hypothetical protein